MKVIPTVALTGMLLVACGQSEPSGTLPTSLAQATTIAAAPTVVVNVPTPMLAASASPASRLTETDGTMPSANQPFRVYGLGGLAASSTRTIEQYQQDVSDAVVRHLAGQLYVGENDIRIIQVQEGETSACGGKTAAPAPDEHTPGVEVIAEANGTMYRYVASGVLAYYCGEVKQ